MANPVYKRSRKAVKWSGKYRDESVKGGWRQVTLFTDKDASQHRLNELESAAAKRAAGCLTPDMEHAKRFVSEHVADYLAQLKPNVCQDHFRIAEWSLEKLLSLTGWTYLRDITAESVVASIGSLVLENGKPASRSYKNKFRTRARAFVNWLIKWDRITGNPLAKLDKFKTGEIRRGRRAYEPAEVTALLGESTPPDRGRVYKVFLLMGLRRNEGQKLEQRHLVLNATVPYVQLWSQGKTRPDQLPLHPELVRMFAGETGRMPHAKVMRVPDIKTFKRDVERAGIAWADHQGRRADFHALRHTFATEVCRREPNVKKAQMLTRHRDVRVLLDIYTHLGIGETAESMGKLTYSTVFPVVLATGTDGPPLVQIAGANGHSLAQTDAAGRRLGRPSAGEDRSEIPGDSSPNLKISDSPAIVPETRPSTQVD